MYMPRQVHANHEEEREPAGVPARHQVAELPPLAAEISEHRLQRVCCPDCGRTMRAELPAGVPHGCFGPKLEAAIASLTVRNRLSRRQLVELMEELFGCPIAVGTVDAILSRTGETLEPICDELLEQTRAASALNIDETGWYLSGEARTLWSAFSKQTAVLRIAPDRGKQHLHGLIGDNFAGIVGSDRFSAYNSLEPERRQVCWSHLRRDFTFHADLGSGAQEAFGLDALEVTWNVFHAWKQFQQDDDRVALQRRVAAIKTQMRPLLEWGATGKRQRHVRALAKNLLKLWPALWTFADVPAVEPTNNAAERGLRAAVIYRKLSLGSRSQGGERTIERLLSVDQTCRLQRRSLYAYLADVPHRQSSRRPYPYPHLKARVELCA
jgi:transposase